MMAKKEMVQDTISADVSKPQPSTPTAMIVNDGEIVRCLNRLVQIEEYRADIERRMLEHKTGIRIPQFKFKD